MYHASPVFGYLEQNIQEGSAHLLIVFSESCACLESGRRRVRQHHGHGGGNEEDGVERKDTRLLYSGRRPQFHWRCHHGENRSRTLLRELVLFKQVTAVVLVEDYHCFSTRQHL